NCHRVIAVTNDVGDNTKVAVTAKLLIPRRLVICRAESTAAMENMASFDTDHIINPYEVFAEHLSLAIRKPQVNELHRWLGARAGRLLEDPLLPPQGRWLIGGFGRFGQACRRYLEARDIPVSVIEQNAQRFADINTDSLIHRIHGSATDPEPLHEAGVEECAGIIAGTDSDTDNLSIVLTARAINPAIYCIARQNHRAEKELFRAADLPLVVEGGRILTWRILPLVTNPLLAEFLAKARCEEDAWAESLMQRLRSHFQNRSPEILEVRIDPAHAAGLYTAMGKRTVRVADLEHNAQGGRSKMAPLLLRTKDEDILCPGRGQTLHRGDCLLLALPERIAHRWEWLLANSAHWGSPTFAQRLGHRTELPDEEVHST
ncbi:MAG: NAD-binding protein, partial [Oceanococcaceae bacterium]